MNRNAIIAIIVVLLLIVGGYLLYANSDTRPVVQNTETEQNNEQTATTTTSVSTSTATSTATSTQTTGTVREFTVTGSNFSFTPATMSVKRGDTVRITFVNQNGFHDFVIDEFNVKTAQIQGGARQTVEFVANKTGTFEYYCSVGNHRAQGMRGTLTVTQ